MPDYLHIILLFLIWIAIAVWVHVRIKRYFLASLVAAVSMVIATQALAYIELGYANPYWLVDALSGFFIGALVSLIVGLPFRLVRKLDKHQQ